MAKILRIFYFMILISSCISICALVAGKLGYPFVGKLLVYFSTLVILSNFFYAAFWVSRKNLAVYRLWRRGHKLDEAVFEVMDDAKIGFKKTVKQHPTQK